MGKGETEINIPLRFLPGATGKRQSITFVLLKAVSPEICSFFSIHDFFEKLLPVF